MSNPSTDVSQADVLHAIANLFAARSSSAAFAHYPTLRIQTNNLHDALSAAILSTEVLIDRWASKLASNELVVPDFQSEGAGLAAYRLIAPAMARNVHRTADFLMEETRAISAVDIDQVERTTPTFSDFIKLGASVRGFLDALVQASYQLTTFDGLQLNYKFLQSLLSFTMVAPASLHANIVSTEMQTALNAYISLSSKDRKNSTFTKAAHDQFPQRLSVCSQAAELPEWRQRNLELLFSFCSDFVHSGYVSVMAVGEAAPSFVMGGPGDAFTPKAENFAELKLRLLAECSGAYADLFLPALRQAIGRMLVTNEAAGLAEELDGAICQVGAVRAVLHRQLVEPVRCGLIGSDVVIKIQCMCGGSSELYPPHHEWDRYCGLCGSRFVLQQVDVEADYVISNSGVGDVLGGDAPRIASLDPIVRAKLRRIAEKHAPQNTEGVNFRLITDLERCDEDTLMVPSVISSAPNDSDRSRCSLIAFVSAKSMERCSTVRITCNCGQGAEYRTSAGTNVVKCIGCNTRIGLLSVTGDGASVATLNPDRTPSTAPIQARDRFSVPGKAMD